MLGVQLDVLRVSLLRYNLRPSPAFSPVIDLVDPELPFSNYFYRQLFSFTAVFETKTK